VVYEGVELATGEKVAVKVMPNDDQTSLKELQLEIDILKESECPFIVGYRGCYMTEEEYWIVMEMCKGGSVSDLIAALPEEGEEDVDGVDAAPLTETEIRAILASAALGLRYLHGKQSIHRDVKAGNILLTTDGTAKLADFGVSAKLTNTIAKRNTVIGSPFWMAPEVIQETNYDGKADIWSLGITAIEIADGNPPLHKIHPMRAIFMIPSKPPPTLQDPNKWSPAFNNFIQYCLNKKADDRPDIHSVLQHQFIKHEIDALSANPNHPVLKALVERTAQSLKRFHRRRKTESLKNPQLAERLSNIRSKSPKRNGPPDPRRVVDDSTLHRVALPSRRDCVGPGAHAQAHTAGSDQNTIGRQYTRDRGSFQSQQSVDYERLDSFQRTGHEKRDSFLGVPLDTKGSMMVLSKKGHHQPFDSFQRNNGTESKQEETTTGLSSALKYFQQPKAQNPGALTSAKAANVFPGNQVENVNSVPYPLPSSVIVTEFQNKNNLEFEKQNSIQQQLEILEIQYKQDLQQLHTAYMQKKKRLEDELEKSVSDDNGSI